MNAQRTPGLRNTKGQFVRNPVSHDRFWDRVHQLKARGHSDAEQIAADEMRLVLILDGIGEVTDFYERRKQA